MVMGKLSFIFLCLFIVQCRCESDVPDQPEAGNKYYCSGNLPFLYCKKTELTDTKYHEITFDYVVPKGIEFNLHTEDKAGRSVECENLDGGANILNCKLDESVKMYCHGNMPYVHCQPNESSEDHSDLNLVFKYQTDVVHDFYVNATDKNEKPVRCDNLNYELFVFECKHLDEEKKEE